MRKTILYLAVLALSISSCSKSDDNNNDAQLMGKWEFYEEGTIVMGQEFITPYQHQTNCTKDFISFEATTVADHFFDGPNCAEDIEVNSYVRNGNVLNVMIEGTVNTSEILILDKNVLKIKTVENIGGQAKHATITFLRR